MKNWKIDLFSLSMFAFNIVQWRLSILRSVVNPWHCPKGSSLRPNKDIQQPFVRRTLAMGRKTVVKRDCFVFRNIWQCFAKCLWHVGWDIVWGYEVTHHVSACHGWQIVSGEWFWMLLIRGSYNRPTPKPGPKGQRPFRLYWRMMTKVCDGDTLLNERIKDIRFCWDAEWFTSCSIQVVAISSLVKSAPFLTNFVWLTSRHLRLTLFNRSLRHFHCHCPRFHRRHSSKFWFTQRFRSVIQPCVHACPN